MLKYERFVELVNELGFMSMNDVVAGFPKIGDYIVEGQYWSDNPELDPWIWKDRVAAEKNYCMEVILILRRELFPHVFIVFFIVHFILT